MKTSLIIICLFSLVVNVYSQQDDKYLYTKDGVNIGLKANLVKLCAEGLAKIYNKMYLSNENYCLCGFEIIASNYTSKELISLLETHPYDYESVFLKEATIDVATRFRNCSITNWNPDYDFSTYPDFKKSWLANCVEGFANNSALLNSNIDAHLYCECTTKELIKRGFTINDIETLKDDNSVLYNEIYQSCFNRLINVGLEKHIPILNAAINIEEINLIKRDDLFRVKLNFGSIEKYFYIDM